ncbi:unnamed protein product, partial [Closterium sp. NIES-54]
GQHANKTPFIPPPSPLLPSLSSPALFVSPGKDVGGFPFCTHGRIMAPILLVDLHKHAGSKGQHTTLTPSIPLLPSVSSIPLPSPSNPYVSPGKDVGGFPFRTHGRIMAPILLVDLHKHAGGKGQHAGASAGLHLVVVSFDGFLYAVDGRTGCADTFDIGETS